MDALYSARSIRCLYKPTKVNYEHYNPNMIDLKSFIMPYLILDTEVLVQEPASDRTRSMPLSSLPAISLLASELDPAAFPERTRSLQRNEGSVESKDDGSTRLLARSGPIKEGPSSSHAPDSDGPTGDFQLKVVEIGQRKFIKLGVLGKGGCSCVYRLLFPATGTQYALKHIKLAERKEFRLQLSEVRILEQLQGLSRVIDLYETVVDEDSCSIQLLTELADCDLAKVISQRLREAALSPFFARMVWQEMLEAVQSVHSRDVVHGKVFLLCILCP